MLPDDVASSGCPIPADVPPLASDAAFSATFSTPRTRKPCTTPTMITMTIVPAMLRVPSRIERPTSRNSAKSRNDTIGASIHCHQTTCGVISMSRRRPSSHVTLCTVSQTTATTPPTASAIHAQKRT